MVSPRLVPVSNPISGVNDVFNGILVKANMVGEVMFYGPGAGKLPTASAVVADMVDIMGHDVTALQAPVWVDATPAEVADPASYICRSLVVLDAPAEAADKLAAIFGELNVLRHTEGRLSFISAELTEAELGDKIARAGYPLVSRIRLL